MKRWDVQGYSFVTDIGQFVKHADYVQVETTLHNWIDKAGGYRCRIDQLESERDTLRAELAECKRDAERYRWIKASSTIEPEGSMWTLPCVWNWIDMPSPALDVERKSFDEAVDVAMRVDAEAALAAKEE